MATWDTEYVAKVAFPPETGSQVAVRDYQFKVDWNAGTYFVLGTAFEPDKEDLWLFDVNFLPNQEYTDYEVRRDSEKPFTEMTFAIGGLQWTYSLKWEFFKQMKDRRWFVCFNNNKWDFKCNDYDGAGRYLWIGIRTPKMPNPAITIAAVGEYASVQSVGLFVRQNFQNEHEFITVKTTGRLTGGFNKRHEGADWYRFDPYNHGVDVIDRCFTIFPKQLYGTKVPDRNLYGTFATINDDDADRALSAFHVNNAKKGPELRPYMWLQKMDTIIISDYYFPGEEIPKQRWRCVTKYTGSPGNKVFDQGTKGFDFFLDKFVTVASIVTSVLSKDVGGAISGMRDLFKPAEVAELADKAGFVSAVTTFADCTPEELGVNIKSIEELRSMNVSEFKKEYFGII